MSQTSKKRPLEEREELSLIPVKRAKTQESESEDALASIQLEPGRTSQLQAPTMLLTGHQADVLSAKFSRNGKHLASASRDKHIFLWDVYGNCTNYGVLKGHKNAVVQVEWSLDDSKIFSGSTDQTVGVWDAQTAKRLLRLSEHEGFINGISAGRQDENKIASVGDDSVCYIWDTRRKSSAQMIQQKLPVISCALLDERNLLFTGGLDNIIHAWDLRKSGSPVWSLNGHADTISSLRMDPEGSFLLSNSMDNSLRVWDVRAFAADNRCTKTLYGIVNGIDKSLLRSNWSHDSKLIGSGSADRNAYIWDSVTSNILFSLPGHVGTVLEVDFHPKEPIVMTCGADKNIYLGELPTL